jgi:serine/threonine protein kinase
VSRIYFLYDEYVYIYFMIKKVSRYIPCCCYIKSHTHIYIYVCIQPTHDMGYLGLTVDEDAIDLIDSILISDPHKRINCKDALDHPYFDGGDDDDDGGDVIRR